MKRGLQLILLIIAMIWLVIAIYYYFQSAQSLAVIFLDVGQGDAVLIKAPHGQNILIDGGPDQKVLEGLATHLPWWDRQLDLIILTHPHADHLTGLNYVLDNYQVAQVMITNISYDSQVYNSFLDKLDQKKVAMTTIIKPLTIDLAPCTLKIIYPLQDLSGVVMDNINNSSIVSKLSCGQLDWLFTGDSEIEAQKELLAIETDVSAEFLKIAHHGSATAMNLAWLQAVQPQLAVISVGANNHFALPSQDVLDQLKTFNIEVKRTDQQGDVQITSQDLATWQIN